MTEHFLTPEQERELEDLQSELARQQQRINVDLQGIGARVGLDRPNAKFVA